MNFKSKKSGFTLAEVMVALALIGFLATLTISTVGASIQQRARLAEFRSVYAKLEATLKNIEFDRGNIYACYYGTVPYSDIDEQGLRMEKKSYTSRYTECNAFIRAFTKAMGTTHSCEDNPIEEGCIPSNYPAAGCSTYDFKEAKRAYVFDNSMIFMTYYAPSSSNFPRMFAVDVNGRKGPNKWGQDIFPFSLSVHEAATRNGVSYVKDVYFTHPNVADATYRSCFVNGAGKTTKEMMKESAGYK